MGKSEKYAWKVSGHSGAQTIATSKTGLFNSPPLVEFFYAGNHKVVVDYHTTKNVKNLSGAGSVRVTESLDDWTPLEFNNISLKDNGGFWVMESGEIFIDLDHTRSIPLNPVYEANEEAHFKLDRYRLDEVGLYAFGQVGWDLPLPALSKDKAVVESSPHWVNFNSFKVNSVIPLPHESNRFDLLDPFAFMLNLDSTSRFYINEDNFTLEFDGYVLAPDKVKRFSQERISFSFTDAAHLFYMEAAPPAFLNPVQPVANTLLWLHPVHYYIDFSEETSPGRHSGSPQWKGIDITDYRLTYDRSPDNKGQMDFTTPFVQRYTQNGQERYVDITSGGFSMKLNVAYHQRQDSLKFQAFPSSPLSLHLEVDENTVAENSRFIGDFLLPFISLERRFGYEIPITNLGFEKGFLTNLEGHQFTFNPEQEQQKIHVTVQRAVLSGNESIKMTIDMHWPGLNVQLSALRDFKIWGDYSVGFSAKNGTVALAQQTTALMGTQKYPLTMEVIGAGSYNGRYLFATTADIVLGEDVSGPGDAPTVNIYSSVENPFVSKEAAGVMADLPEDVPTMAEATAKIKEETASYKVTLLNQLTENDDALRARVTAYQQGLPGSTIYAPEDILVREEPVEEAGNTPQDKLYPIAEGFVRVLVAHYLKPIDKELDKYNKVVEDMVNEQVSRARGTIDDGVDNLVDAITGSLIRALQNEKIDVDLIISDLGGTTGESVKKEIRHSLEHAVEVNVLTPVRVLLKERIQGRIYDFFMENGTDLVYATFRGQDPGGALGDFANDIPGLVGKIAEDALQLIDPNHLESTVAGLAGDFVKGIDGDAIFSEIKGKASARILEELEKMGKDLVEDAVADVLEEAGLPPFLGEESPINFVDMGTKLADGDYAGAVKEAFAIDPVPLRMSTPIVDLAGTVYFTPDYPGYGDVWVGDIAMNIKVPKPFTLNGLYINGRADDTDYWFVEVRGNEDSSQEDPQKRAAKGGYDLGHTIKKKVRPLANPVNMGIVDLVGVSGRLYHHMAETSDGGIVPDPGMDRGAYMNMVFFDRQAGGEVLRMAVAGQINTKTNGNSTLAFSGDLQVLSPTPTVQGTDESAPIQGSLEMEYNSAEKHFFGYAEVELFQPGVLCAEGSLLVDVKPGAWRVALGRRNDRLQFVPGCFGWSPTGWLDVNQQEAELGLGAQLSVKATTPTINVFLIKAKFIAEAGIAIGVMAAIQYKPKLALNRAGYWADLWAKVVVKYKVRRIKKFKIRWSRWKQKVLFEIALHGDMIVYFVPKPTMLKGTLSGRVRVLGFKKSINAKLKQKI